MDDTEDVQLLTLVLVNTLNLNIKERCWVDLDAVVLHDVLRESHLVGVLDVAELLAELFVVNKRLELVQQSEVFQELVAAQLRCDKSREFGVSLVKPSPWGDTVGDVGELVRSVDFDEVLEDGSLDQVRM